MRWVQVLLLSLLIASCLFVGYALLARFVLHGPVTGRSLVISVEEASGSAGGLLNHGRCRPTRAPREWRCEVTDSAGSGGATYTIRLRPGSSCWDGVLTNDASEGGMPKTIEDCVRRWQWSLF